MFLAAHKLSKGGWSFDHTGQKRSLFFFNHVIAKVLVGLKAFSNRYDKERKAMLGNLNWQVMFDHTERKWIHSWSIDPLFPVGGNSFD